MKRANHMGAMLSMALTLGSCGSTGGALVVLPFQAGGVARAAPGPMTFNTPTGWNVELTQAVIALGPFYFNVSPPDSQNFRSGTVIIEATEQVVLDALDPTLHDVPGGADGETGPAVAVEIDLFPADSTQSAANQQLLPGTQLKGGTVGVIAGIATKGAATVPFQGAITIDSNLVTATASLPSLQRVNGAVVQLDFTAAPQTLSLRVDPTAWFQQADFSTFLSGASGTSQVNGVYTWNETSTFLNQLSQGVKLQASVYQFALAPQ